MVLSYQWPFILKIIFMQKSLFKVFLSSLPKGILIGLCLALLGTGLLFLVQDRYRSSADFLVTSSQGGQDYYTATRSAEYMSRVLSEVLYSERFMDALIETGKVNEAAFPRDKKERLETWAKTLSVKRNSEIGLVSAAVTGQNDRDVLRLSQALVQVLDTNSAVVFGEETQNIKVRLLSGPILERNPSASQFMTLLIAGIACGIFGVFSARLIQKEFSLPEAVDPRQ